MTFTFMDAILYIINTINKIPIILKGFSYYTHGGLKLSINKLKEFGTHIDITNKGEDNFYTALGISFWISFIFSLIGLLFISISLGFIGIFTSVIGTIGQILGFLFCLLIYASIIYFGNKYKGNWNLTIVKVLIVLYLCNIVLSVFGVLNGGTDFIKSLSSFNLFTSFYYILDIIADICTLLGSGLILNSFNFGIIKTNNSEGYKNPNTGFGIPRKSNKDNNINTEQMYACPYCGKAVYYNQSPCPYCSNIINWEN